MMLANLSAKCGLFSQEFSYNKSRFDTDEQELALNRDLFDITQVLAAGLAQERLQVGAVSEAELNAHDSVSFKF